MSALESVRAIAIQKRQLGERELENSTWHFRRRIEAGAGPDELLPEVLATAYEVLRRHGEVEVGDLEVAAAVRLCEGDTPEKLGDSGLVAVLIAYFHTLIGSSGVHVAALDDEATGQLGQRLKVLERVGAEVGAIEGRSSAERRSERYAADIVIAPFSTLMFDYLHDNLSRVPDERRQRARDIAIVDRADLLLGALAREPGNISESREIDQRRFRLIARLADGMRAGIDYRIEKSDKTTHLTRRGIKRIRAALEQPDPDTVSVAAFMRDLEALLATRTFYRRDRDYEIDGSGVHWNLRPPRIVREVASLDAGVPVGTEQVIARIRVWEYFALYRVVRTLGTPKRPPEMGDLIDLDRPLAEQRLFVYTERDRLVDHQPARQDVPAAFRAWLPTALARTIEHGISEDTARALWEHLGALFPLSTDVRVLVARSLQALTIEEVGDLALADFQDAYRRRVAEWPRAEVAPYVTRLATIVAIDKEWPRHLTDMELLRYYADHKSRRGAKAVPFFRREADQLFGEFISRVQLRLIEYFFKYDLIVSDSSTQGESSL